MKMKPYKDTLISALGMGNMRLPLRSDIEGAPIDRNKAGEIIELAMKSGINYYDTAYVYNGGDSERFLGEAMSKYDRASYHLATKFHIAANSDYKAVFEQQLKRLNTDYIDFYLVHAVTDDSAEAYEKSGCIEYFAELKEKGKIKYLGFSNHSSVETLKHFITLYNWDFIQLQLNYFDWRYGSARAEYSVCEEKNIPIIVMEPVRGGKLAQLPPNANELLKAAHPDWSIASWAMRWVKALPQVMLVLSGMSTLEQTQDNINTFSGEQLFTPQDEELVMKACDIFKNHIHVPCTSCRYCCDDCPAKINIPSVMDVYNDFRLSGDWALDGLKAHKENGPADCVDCKKCASLCPQGIKIPDIMKELADRLN